MGYFWVGEGDGRDLTVLCGAVGSGEVVADDAEVVVGGVGEVGGAGTVSYGPDAGGSGFEAAVDLEVASRSRFNTDDVEAHVLRVRHAAGRDEDV